MYGNSKFLSYLMFYNFKIQCVFFQIGSKLSMRGYIISHNDIHYVCNIISFCSWKFLINLLFESQYSILDSIFVLVKVKNLQCNIEFWINILHHTCQKHWSKILFWNISRNFDLYLCLKSYEICYKFFLINLINFCYQNVRSQRFVTFAKY